MPAGRIYRAADMLADPHYLARQAIVRLADPSWGRSRCRTWPAAVGHPGPGRLAGPTLGQHNREVYQGLLGLPDEEVERLADQAVI